MTLLGISNIEVILFTDKSGVNNEFYLKKYHDRNIFVVVAAAVEGWSYFFEPKSFSDYEAVKHDLLVCIEKADSTEELLSQLENKFNENYREQIILSPDKKAMKKSTVKDNLIKIDFTKPRKDK